MDEWPVEMMDRIYADFGHGDPSAADTIRPLASLFRIAWQAEEARKRRHNLVLLTRLAKMIQQGLTVSCGEVQ